MIQITIDDKEFKIVNNYNEMTLGQYIDILKVSELKVKLEGNTADIKIISILSDKPDEIEKLLWSFNIDDFEQLTSLFEWVADTKIVEHFKTLKPTEKLMIADKEYTILSDYKKMTLGEIVSFETILAQQQSDLHRFDIAFGVLLRPLVDGKMVEFSQETFDEVIKEKYKVKMVDIYSTISFFLSGEKMSTTKHTKRFSTQVI